MANHPERIYHWLNSQLSIARFAGSITINGVTYIVATHVQPIFSKMLPSLIEELQAHGYDITTLKFSIQKKRN